MPKQPETVTRTETALAEIERMDAEVRTYGLGGDTDGLDDWMLDVLRGDREVLQQHAPCPCPAASAHCAACLVKDWPCPDAARVLDRYAPEETDA